MTQDHTKLAYIYYYISNVQNWHFGSTNFILQSSDFVTSNKTPRVASEWDEFLTQWQRWVVIPSFYIRAKLPTNSILSNVNEDTGDSSRRGTPIIGFSIASIQVPNFIFVYATFAYLCSSWSIRHQASSLRNQELLKLSSETETCMERNLPRSSTIIKNRWGSLVMALQPCNGPAGWG